MPNARTPVSAWQRLLPAAALAALMAAVSPNPALAQDDETVLAGRQLAQERCARCHAIAIEGSSPVAEAPPFRVLSERYPISDLEEALAEGIVTAHPAMPQFELEPVEITSLLAFIESVQER